MNYEPGRILVTGVTGRLGRVAARELSKKGYSVRGMTRDPSGAVARELATEGIEIVQGDFENPDSVVKACKDIHGVYLIVIGAINEEEYVKVGVDAALKNKVSHLIYCSYTSADPQYGYEKAPARFAEDYIRASNIPHTIFRAVDFMENYTSSYPWWKEETLENGVRDPRSPDFMRQFIAIKDIVFFVVEAFDNPSEWLGRELNIAGDEIELGEMPKFFSHILGRPLELKKIAWEDWEKDFSIPPLIVDIFKWYEESRFVVDVTALRKQYPHMQTFEDFLKEASWGSE